MVERSTVNDGSQVRFLPSAPLHHYVIARADLPLGVLAAQIVHAAGESSGEVPSGTHAVCLAVPDEDSLERLCERLLRYDIPFVAIREPDAPWNGALMTVGIPPMVRTTNLRRAVSRLSLLGETS